MRPTIKSRGARRQDPPDRAPARQCATSGRTKMPPVRCCRPAQRVTRRQFLISCEMLEAQEHKELDHGARRHVGRPASRRGEQVRPPIQAARARPRSSTSCAASASSRSKSRLRRGCLAEVLSPAPPASRRSWSCLTPSAAPAGSPAYEARLSESGTEVGLASFATVSQSTGEDWRSRAHHPVHRHPAPERHPA